MSLPKIYRIAKWSGWLVGWLKAIRWLLFHSLLFRIKTWCQATIIIRFRPFIMKYVFAIGTPFSMQIRTDMLNIFLIIIYVFRMSFSGHFTFWEIKCEMSHGNVFDFRIQFQRGHLAGDSSFWFKTYFRARHCVTLPLCPLDDSYSGPYLLRYVICGCLICLAVYSLCCLIQH